MGEVLRIKFYTNYNNLNLNVNKLLLITTAIDPQYQLSAFPSYSKLCFRAAKIKS